MQKVILFDSITEMQVTRDLITPRHNKQSLLCTSLPHVVYSDRSGRFFDRRNGWLVGRLTSPFSRKIGYIGDKVLDGDLVPPG